MIVTTDDDAVDRWHAGRAFFVVVSALTLGVDFASKSWVRHRVGGFLDSADFGPFLTIVMRPNPGGAWGMMTGVKETVTRVVFSLVSLIAIVVVIWLHRRLQSRRPGFTWGLPLVLGGALGNLLDRLRFGRVVDFVDLHLLVGGVQRHSPYFNIADVAITIGVGLMAVDVLRRTSDAAMGPG
jgi:signal peptidase II